MEGRGSFETAQGGMAWRRRAYEEAAVEDEEGEEGASGEGREKRRPPRGRWHGDGVGSAYEEAAIEDGHDAAEKVR